eukprot:CAMPEP_0119014674 /NCGR_PEP_ID=MMETSP1176-20130426/10186_1 /TAXON_ID=265551 /ORGANISM="Synedropsis recta cf, Strain CCMP1620" /LENGTH=166 /DNA_ID=CAMNT_0006967893 /DNA_START=25 /DNA_END=525 /DNA_ORIENTATION=+
MAKTTSSSLPLTSKFYHPSLGLHSRRNRKLVALVLGITILYLSMSQLTSAQTSASAPFSLLVTLLFSDSQYKNQFLQDFAPLATYVRDNEPTTIAYETLQSDSDPLKILILERYRDKEKAYLQIHKSSRQFLDFRPKLMRLQESGHVTIDGNSYVDTMIGFGDRVK